MSMANKLWCILYSIVSLACQLLSASVGHESGFIMVPTLSGSPEVIKSKSGSWPLYFL